MLIGTTPAQYESSFQMQLPISDPVQLTSALPVTWWILILNGTVDSLTQTIRPRRGKSWMGRGRNLDLSIKQWIISVMEVSGLFKHQATCPETCAQL